MAVLSPGTLTIYRSSWQIVTVALILIFSLVAIFWDAFGQMAGFWFNTPEYSHGILIPVISAFLIWQQRFQIQSLPDRGNWLGISVVALGLSLWLLGELATLYVVTQYSFIIVLAGLVLAYRGVQGLRLLGMPLLILVFMIPLPQFLYQGLSSQLQLWSSQLGVSFIRFCDISVHLEGNVIDLGAMQLQVVEACNGLRYLFPLMTVGFILAYFFKAAFWKRILIFLSAIPLTIGMNSLRIGIIGVMVEYWGPGMAEGFLHDFEGWAVFMVSFAVLLAEMALLARIGSDARPLKESFAIDWPEAPKDGAGQFNWRIPKTGYIAGGLLVIVALMSVLLPQREEIEPSRQSFSQFPLAMEGWSGREGRLEQTYINALKFDDYFLADYRDGNSSPVNFYVAYYASQRKGQSAHSPRSCIPGGGWRIEGLERRELSDISIQGRPLAVNRVQIAKGDHRQLVYYWFQQRGRVVTNEYLVKWYLFWDALTKNRTDGALVRLVVNVGQGQSIEAAEGRLKAFARTVALRLDGYIPD